jgi:sialic acid synthase SpsE
MNIFEDLFILEMANNHQGSVERGLKIIKEYRKIVQFNNVRAAIKLQFRSSDLIHKDYRNRTDVRYIKKTLSTQLTDEQYGVLVQSIRDNGCIPMSTPFDEKSVDLCVKLNLPVIKLASSGINDWLLIERVAATKKPVIVSTGGSSLKDIDDIVVYFERRNIPLAINHCVSFYPTEDDKMELNQIDFLKNRYPGHTIGLSTHEYHNLSASMFISYAKGVRMWERHIDLDTSPYNSLPHQIDEWFKAYHKVRELSGGSSTVRRIISSGEMEYLNQTVRGVYANKNLKKNQVISDKDVYLAIPLLKGQLSCRELISGEQLITDIKENRPIYIDSIDSVYATNDTLKGGIYERGISAS